MIINELKRDKAKNELDYFENNYQEGQDFFSLNDEYRSMRKTIFEIHAKIKQKKEYLYDLEMALQLYQYFNDQKWFNESIASNYDFWRYICVKVAPEIIVKRHGFNREYFYDKNVRMYFPTMWWYIHMSYQGEIAKTRKCLENLNTDYILQLVERPGRSGMYLEITREIIKRISLVPRNVLNKKIGGLNLFRRVLLLNTAKINNYNLVLEHNVEKYVENLLVESGGI